MNEDRIEELVVLCLEAAETAGWDAVEAAARSFGAQLLARGTVYGTLNVQRQGVAPVVRVNEPVLAAD